MTTSEHVHLPYEGNIPSLAGATGWLNSEPLDTGDLRGHVVLVQFWTYTCINWLRTLPYIRAWAKKYKQQGVVVVGVHSPEFEFEGDVDNIRWALRDRSIDYPVAVDSDYEVWSAFANRYWPALYLVDTTGAIRFHHFGEGRYEETERAIQALLAEAGADGVGKDLVSVEGEGPEAPADWDDLDSPETYVGYERTERFASPGGVGRPDEPRRHVLPERLRLNQWALSGEWTMRQQGVLLNAPDGVIAYRFRARDLNLVMGPAAPETSARFRVLVDGQSPGAAHGVDVDEDGNGLARERRLYQLVRQPDRVAEHTFEITFLDPGVEANVFTFG